jgi:hypothetical protein
VDKPKAELDRWSIEDFEGPLRDGGNPPGEALGRWQRQDLLVPAGKTMPFWGPPFRDVTTNDTGLSLLTIWPAFAAGEPKAFVITDIWQNQPRPWVQPVYMGEENYETRPEPPSPSYKSVFPVKAGASFYSPYWRAEYFNADAGRQFYSAEEVLNTRVELSAGGLIYCPLLPIMDDGGVVPFIGVKPLAGNTYLTHPLSTITYRDVANDSYGFVGGKSVNYLGFGTSLDLAPSQGDVVIDSPMYLFTRVVTEPAPLRLPPVLADDPVHHSLVRVVDVQLPAAAMVYLSAQFIGRGMLEMSADGGWLYEGLPVVTSVDQPVDVDRYNLRVLLNAGCLAADAGFPRTCDWLDSAARIEQLSSALRHTSEVTAAIGVLKESSP